MEMETALPQNTGAPVSTGAENSVGSEFAGMAANLASEHGAAVPGGGVNPPAPRKRGRPPIHGRYAAKSLPSVPPPGQPACEPAGGDALGSIQTEQSGTPGVSLPADLQRSLVVVTLGTLENGVKTALATQALACGLESVDISAQLERATISPKSKEYMGDVFPLMLQEWGLNPNVSPTVAFAAVFVPWAMGATTAFMGLFKLAKEKAARDAREK